MRFWRGLWLVLVSGAAVLGTAVTVRTASASAQIGGAVIGVVIAMFFTGSRGPVTGPARSSPRAGMTARRVLLSGWIGWCVTGSFRVLGSVAFALVLLLLAGSPPVVRWLAAGLHRGLDPHGSASSAPAASRAPHSFRSYPSRVGTVTEVAATSSAKAGWIPVFVDYLYLSTTNSSAFSPTDTMPLSSRAKLLMALQATAALFITLLVIARAVGSLGGGGG